MRPNLQGSHEAAACAIACNRATALPSMTMPLQVTSHQFGSGPLQICIDQSIDVHMGCMLNMSSQLRSLHRLIQFQ